MVHPSGHFLAAVSTSDTARMLQAAAGVVCFNSTCPLSALPPSCPPADKETHTVVFEWALIVFLISLSGLFSGLTLGLRVWRFLAGRSVLCAGCCSCRLL